MNKCKRFSRSLFLAVVTATLFGSPVLTNTSLAQTSWFITNGSTSTGNQISYYGYSVAGATPVGPTTIASGLATPSGARNDRLYVYGANASATFDGATAEVNCFGIGNVAGHVDTLNLTNGTVLNVRNGTNNMLWVGGAGTGTLNILSGSKVTVTNGLAVGFSDGTGDGTVLVSGAGSTLTVNGGNGLQLGGLTADLTGKKGVLAVENGGTVNVTTLLEVGKNATGAGEVWVKQGGTLTAVMTHTGNGTTYLDGGVLNLNLRNNEGTGRFRFASNGGTLNLKGGTINLNSVNGYWGNGTSEIHLSLGAGTNLSIANGSHTNIQPVFHLDRLNCNRYYDDSTVGAYATKLYMNNTDSGAYTSYLDSYCWPVGIVNAGTEDTPVTFNAAGGSYRFQTLNVGADGKSGYLVLKGGSGTWLGGASTFTDPQMKGGMVIGEIGNAAGSGTVVLSEGTTLKRTDANQYSSDRNIHIGVGLGAGRLIFDGGLTDTTWNKTYLGANGTIEIASGDYSVAARNIMQNDGHFEVSGGKLGMGGQTIKMAAISSEGAVYQSGTAVSQLLLDNTAAPYSGTVGTMSGVQYIEVHAIAGTEANPVVIGEAGKTTNYGVRVLGSGGLEGQSGYLKLAGGADTKIYVQGAPGTNGGLNIGNRANTTGTLIVGENVKVTVNGDTTPRVGNAGTGTITVEAGGSITNTQSVLVASAATGKGTVNLYGSWTSTDTVYLGGYNAAGGTGTVNVYDGGNLTVKNNGISFWGDKSSVNIYEGGSVNSILNFGNATKAELNIQGGTFTGHVNGQNEYYTDKTLAINIKDGGTFNLTAGGARINSVTGTGDFIINNSGGLLNISGNDAIVGNTFTGGNIYNDARAGSNSVLYFNSTANAYQGVISGRQGNGTTTSGTIDGVVNVGTETTPVTFSATKSTSYGQYGIKNDTGMAFRNFIVGGDILNKNAVDNASGKYNNDGVNANAYALLDGGTYSVGLNSNGLIVGQGKTDTGVLKLQNGAKFTSDGATIRIGVFGTGELIITGSSQVGTNNQVALVGYAGGTGDGTITVDGAGSKFYVNQLHLGGYQPEAASRGASGTVNISNGGTVTINNNTYVGMDAAKGVLNIDGGTLTTNNLTLAENVGQINFLSATQTATPITVSGTTSLNGSISVNVSGVDFTAGPITLIDSATMTKGAGFTVQGIQNNAGGNHVDWSISNGDLKIGEVQDIYTSDNIYLAKTASYGKWNTAGNWKNPDGTVKTSAPNAQSLVIIGTDSAGNAMNITGTKDAAFSSIYVGYNLKADNSGVEISKGTFFIESDNSVTGRFNLGNGSLTAFGGQNTKINGTIVVEGAGSLGANGDNRKLNITADISSYSAAAPGSLTISSALNSAGGETVGKDGGGAIVLSGNNANYHGEWILGTSTRRATITANSVDALGTGSTITMTNNVATNANPGVAGSNRGQTLNVNATQINISKLSLGTLSQVNLANGIEFHVGEITKETGAQDNYAINWGNNETKVYVQKMGSVQNNVAIALNQQKGELNLYAGNDSYLADYSLGAEATLNLLTTPTDYLGFTLADGKTATLAGTINVLLEGENWYAPIGKEYLFAGTDFDFVTRSLDDINAPYAWLLGQDAGGIYAFRDAARVPEPASWALLILSCAGLYFWRRKK